MLIYRVEHEDNPYKGMYCSDTSDEFFELKGSHPAPEDDSKFVRSFESLTGKSWHTYGEIRHYRFGFSSVDQFKRWVFNDVWRKALDDEGYVIVVYDARDYAVGDTQAVFRPATATQLKVMKLTEV
jgi:hypothetical protein